MCDEDSDQKGDGEVKTDHDWVSGAADTKTRSQYAEEGGGRRVVHSHSVPGCRLRTQTPKHGSRK